jgi:uncharacterized protein
LLIADNRQALANERNGRHAEGTLGTVKVIQVRVKPSARAGAFVEKRPGLWSAQLKSPPVDGRANEELIALVAKEFGCRKSAVLIKSGASGRMKLVGIES